MQTKGWTRTPTNVQCAQKRGEEEIATSDNWEAGGRRRRRRRSAAVNRVHLLPSLSRELEPGGAYPKEKASETITRRKGDRGGGRGGLPARKGGGGHGGRKDGGRGASHKKSRARGGGERTMEEGPGTKDKSKAGPLLSGKRRGRGPPCADSTRAAFAGRGWGGCSRTPRGGGQGVLPVCEFYPCHFSGRGRSGIPPTPEAVRRGCGP